MQNLGKHISTRFDLDIKQLSNHVIEMMDLVSQELDTAFSFYKNPLNETLLKLKSLDKKVNDLEVEINHLCLEILAKHSPMATDLRIVLVVVKIIANLERMGDQYLKFAEQLNHLLDAPFYQNPKIDALLKQLIQTSSTMLQKVKVAFEKSDVKFALEVVKIDQTIDQHYCDLILQLSAELAHYASEEMAIKYSDFIVILRALERFGDRIVNIAHLIIYAVENEDVAHHSYRDLSKLLDK